MVSTVDGNCWKKKFNFFHSLISSALYQKRYNRDRKYRFRLQKQIEEEYERHSRLEDILRKSGSSESLKSFIGKISTKKFFIDFFQYILCIIQKLQARTMGNSLPRKITTTLANGVTVKVMRRCPTQRQPPPIPRKKKCLVQNQIKHTQKINEMMQVILKIQV